MRPESGSLDEDLQTGIARAEYEVAFQIDEFRPAHGAPYQPRGPFLHRLR